MYFSPSRRTTGEGELPRAFYIDELLKMPFRHTLIYTYSRITGYWRVNVVILYQIYGSSNLRPPRVEIPKHVKMWTFFDVILITLHHKCLTMPCLSSNICNNRKMCLIWVDRDSNADPIAIMGIQWYFKSYCAYFLCMHLGTIACEVTE